MTATLPKPFLKWVGGKRQLLPELMRHIHRLPLHGKFQRYHEPFLGGGALFFSLYREGMLGRKQAWLSDVNGSVVDAWQGVKTQCESVIGTLRKFERTRHSVEMDHYYGMRRTMYHELYLRAARVIYLNKTCFNGLWRENLKGEMNTPYGRYKNPNICDEPNLRTVAEALKGAMVERRGFETVLTRAKHGDLIYFDPPYHPVSDTASFTRFDKSGFGRTEQLALAAAMHLLTNAGVHVMASNSDTPYVRTLYEGFHIHEVQARRSVNSKGSKRGKVGELIVTSW